MSEQYILLYSKQCIHSQNLIKDIYTEWLFESTDAKNRTGLELPIETFQKVELIWE